MKSSDFESKCVVLLVSICVFITAAFLAGCDEDGPSGSVPPPPLDYPVYVMMGKGVDSLLRFWPAANAVDTLPIPVPINGSPGISADGTLLYLPSDSQLVVVAADALQTILDSAEIHCCGYGPAVSPDGGRIITESGLQGIGWEPRPVDLLVLDASLNVRYDGEDESLCGDITFSDDGTHAYHLAAGMEPDIRILDLIGTPYVSTVHTVETGWPVALAAIPNSSRVLLTMSVEPTGGDYVLAVYDMDLDSIVFRDDRFQAQPFRAVATHDGSHAYYGIDPATLVEYDVEGNCIAREIDLQPAFGIAPTIFVARTVAVTPDDRLLVLQSDNSSDRTGVLVYDRLTGEFVSYRPVPWSIMRLTVPSGM